MSCCAGRRRRQAVAPARPVPAPAWRAAVAVALAGLLGLGIGYVARRPQPATGDERWLLAVPDGLTLSLINQPALALSRDGRLQVAVVTSARGITAAAAARQPGASAAAAARHRRRQLALLFARRRLDRLLPPERAVQAAGRRRPSGPPRRLQRPVQGRRVGRGRFRVLRARHCRRPVARSERMAGPPPRSPGPTRAATSARTAGLGPSRGGVLFTSDTAASTEYYDDARIEAVRPATGERKVLIENACMARYAGERTARVRARRVALRRRLRPPLVVDQRKPDQGPGRGRHRRLLGSRPVRAVRERGAALGSRRGPRALRPRLGRSPGE